MAYHSYESLVKAEHHLVRLATYYGHRAWLNPTKVRMYSTAFDGLVYSGHAEIRTIKRVGKPPIHLYRLRVSHTIPKSLVPIV